MTVTSVSRDRALRAAVEEELEWTPGIDSVAIGVAVRDGCVSLSGEVASHTERLAVARATLRIRGVTAIVDELMVRPTSVWAVTPADIARSVSDALASSADIPPGIKADVRGARVTLSGVVRWHYERRAAERAVERIRGVRGVRNLIAVRPRVAGEKDEENLRAAIRRDALLDGADIRVRLDGDVATLTGSVGLLGQKHEAERVAWCSPAVREVRDELVVDPLADIGNGRPPRPAVHCTRTSTGPSARRERG